MMRLGILGLGRAAYQVLRALPFVAGVRLSAVSDVNEDALAAFAPDMQVERHCSASELAASPKVDAIWIATPSFLHCDHTLLAAAAGKHVICDKPMAITLDECQRMVSAIGRARTQLLMVSKTFDPPIRKMKAIIDSGEVGRVVTINMIVYTDWMTRPRLPEEYDVSLGGGVVFRQGPHLVDIARYLAGGEICSIVSTLHSQPPRPKTPGAFNALLSFEHGATANISFNGFGVFDTAELTWNHGETGRASVWRAPPGEAHPSSAAVKASHARQSINDNVTGHAFYGLTIVACEHGLIRQSEGGIYIYAREGRREEQVTRTERCVGELMEMRDMFERSGTQSVFPNGQWGAETMRACLNIMSNTLV